MVGAGRGRRSGRDRQATALPDIGGPGWWMFRIRMTALTAEDYTKYRTFSLLGRLAVAPGRVLRVNTFLASEAAFGRHERSRVIDSGRLA